MEFTSIVTLFAKLSLLLFYLRLFSIRGLRYSIFFAIGFISLFYTAILFLFIFLDNSTYFTLSVTVGSVNIVTDFYILILPIAPVLRIPLSKRKRIGVLGIFLTASLYVPHIQAQLRPNRIDMIAYG